MLKQSYAYKCEEACQTARIVEGSVPNCQESARKRTKKAKEITISVYLQALQRWQACSAEGAVAIPPSAVSRSVEGRACPTSSITCAISSKGTMLGIPDKTSCAEEKAAATPMALRF